MLLCVVLAQIQSRLVTRGHELPNLYVNFSTREALLMIGDRLLCGGARCVRRLRRASSRFVASSTYRHPCNHYERLGRCFWIPEANCTPSLTKPGSAGSLHGYKRRDYNDGRKEKLLRLGSRDVSPARRIPQKPPIGSITVTNPLPAALCTILMVSEFARVVMLPGCPPNTLPVGRDTIGPEG